MYSQDFRLLLSDKIKFNLRLISNIRIHLIFPIRFQYVSTCPYSHISETLHELKVMSAEGQKETINIIIYTRIIGIGI